MNPHTIIFNEDTLCESQGTKYYFRAGEKGYYLAEYSDGVKWYWQGEIRHREDGPAIEEPFGIDEGFSYKWWYKGETIICNSQKEFEKLIKLKAFW